MLLHCFAGCSYDEILVSLGLEHRSQTAALKQSSPGTTTDYDLIDPETAQVVATHRRIDYRDDTKTFFYLRDGKFNLDGLPTSALPLYGMSEAIGAPAGTTIVFTEGEKPRDALTARGVLSVGSACGASVTPDNAQLRFLERFRVILWPDNDDAGRDHMKETHRGCVNSAWRSSCSSGPTHLTVETQPISKATMTL